MKRDHLQKLFQHVLDKGFKKTDRTGVGTISTFGYQERFNLKQGFPIATTKKVYFKAAITELIWMIGGWMKEPQYAGVSRTNIKYLVDNNVRIWTEWPYKKYKEVVELSSNGDDFFMEKDGPRILTQEEFYKRIKADKNFAIKWGELGPVYQKQWRDFEGKNKAVDQLKNMIERLKNNPDCRRNLTSYWNPTELDEMLLPPCHLLHQVWTRPLALHEIAKASEERLTPEQNRWMGIMDVEEAVNKFKLPTRAISLQMYQRSSDCFLGVPFDWVFYAALTHILAEQTNMVPDEFVWTSGDTHLYLNSIDAVKELLTRDPYNYPKFRIKRKVDNIEDYQIDDFELDGYEFHPPLKVEVAV